MHQQSTRTLQDARTTLSPDDVIGAATAFFSRHNAIYTAFLEKEGPGWATYRGQGGEEIAIGAQVGPDGVTRVTGSSYLFDQQVARFLSLLPVAPAEVPAAALGSGEDDGAEAGARS
jgi:hypothetical protein